VVTVTWALGFVLTFWTSMLALAEGRYVLFLVLFVVGQLSAWSVFYGGERS
jgi:hypothetical protein